MNTVSILDLTPEQKRCGVWFSGIKEGRRI